MTEEQRERLKRNNDFLRPIDNKTDMDNYEKSNASFKDAAIKINAQEAEKILTKREYIATQIMTQMAIKWGSGHFEKAAIDSVEAADFLIKHLDKNKPANEVF